MGRGKGSAPPSGMEEGAQPPPLQQQCPARAAPSPLQGQRRAALSLITHLKYKKERVTKAKAEPLMGFTFQFLVW